MVTLPLSEAKSKLAQLLRETEEFGERFEITRSGRRAAVLLSAEEYDGLIETLEILADADLLAGIERGLSDIEQGRVVDHQTVWGPRAVDPSLRG